MFSGPVARAEYRRPTGSIQASLCLSPRRKYYGKTSERSEQGYFFAPGELASARGARNGGRSRALRGVLSFGYLSLHEQRKVTLGAGREHPAFT